MGRDRLLPSTDNALKPVLIIAGLIVFSIVAGFGWWINYSEPEKTRLQSAYKREMEAGKTAFIQGKYLSAIKMHRAALGYSQKSRKMRLASQAALAEDYMAAGLSRDAMSTVADMRQSLSSMKGPEKTEFLPIMAEVYANCGPTQEAKQFCQEAFAALPATEANRLARLQLTIRLAQLQWQSKEKSAAATTLEQAGVLAQAYEGVDSLQAAVAWHDLARLYASRDDYKKAEEFELRALGARQMKLGPSHHLVAETLSTLGSIKQKEGKLSEAAQFSRNACQIWTTSFGPDSAHTAAILSQMAEVYQQQKSYKQAQDCSFKALESARSAFTPDNPLVIPYLVKHAAILRKSGAAANARYFEEQAKTLRAQKT